MQKELGAISTKVPIQILGVNGAGLEVANDIITKDRVLPWLQDTDTDQVWQSWAVEYRDVVVVDAKNYKVTAYNLTAHNLGDANNFATLKALLVDTANAQ